MTAKEKMFAIGTGIMLPTLCLVMLLCHRLGFPWWIPIPSFGLAFVVFCYLTWRQKSEESEKAEEN